MHSTRHRSGLIATALLASIPLATSLAAGEPGPCRPASAAPDFNQPDLDCRAPPNTFDVAPFLAATASPETMLKLGPTWDAWAWASFAAMNWPAQKASGASASGYVRGIPDLTATFLEAESTDVLVWETLKEKRELFQPDPTTITQKSLWQDITFAPTQQPAPPGGSTGLQKCEGSPPYPVDKPLRLMAQGTKVFFNTDDETVEVASPAQELAATLCAGFPTTAPSGGGLTQAGCETIFPAVAPGAINPRPPVGPRIWKGDPGTTSDATPIYFEVKVNYDFWAYILGKQYFLDEIAMNAAGSSSRDVHPKLPFRTSSSHGPGRSPLAVYGYDANQVVDEYSALASLQPEAIPGVGSIQLKAAWLPLGPTDDASSYHTTTGLLFRQVNETTKCYQVTEFGLLGLHIIQRVHSSSFTRANPEPFAHGGTFIFATWEHMKSEPSDFYYANFITDNFANPEDPDGPKLESETIPFPNLSTGVPAIQVTRMQPFPLKSTAAVNAAVHAQLSTDSVWQNYHLIGTQFMPASAAESLLVNQPYLLANLFVETNTGLQNFTGLPPFIGSPTMITPYYTKKVTFANPPNSTTFQPEAANLIFNRETAPPVNMGGCMGCHGVAQLKGYNFSFVFAGGQKGGDIDTLKEFNVAGAPPNDPPTSGSTDSDSTGDKP